MRLGDLIDGAIAPISPAWAADRRAARARLEANSLAVNGLRQYDAATYGRRTVGWNRTASSADAEAARGRQLLMWAGHDLVRNNKYAASGVRQLVAMMWGDGIAPQALHPVKLIQKRAQAELDRFCESKVDGVGDFYGHGKISCREMIVGGESLTAWQPDERGPDGRLVGLEGAQLDMAKTTRLANGGKIVQGVQFEGGVPTGYWLFDEHPNDVIFAGSLLSRFVPAAHVDHLFERLRHRQTRGVSWLGAVAMTLRDIGDIEDNKRLQAKIQACLALIIQPGEGREASHLSETKSLDGDTGAKPLGETMTAGMIARLGQGETATAITPTPSSDTVAFLKQQLGAVSANLVPYHLMTGDTSQANYTGLKAAMNGGYALVGDWQQNEVIPLLCRPMAVRRMRRLALETGDRRYLDVRFNWALPRRMIVDPIKDLMGEVIEIRAGLKTISEALASRGINAEEHLAEIARMNKLIDDLELVLETDPRKLTRSGIMQALEAHMPSNKDKSEGE